MMVRAVADELLYNEKQNEVIFIKYLGNGEAGDATKAAASPAHKSSP